MWFNKDIYECIRLWQMQPYQPYVGSWNVQHELNMINGLTLLKLRFKQWNVMQYVE
jgi:hypothetical protein